MWNGVLLGAGARWRDAVNLDARRSGLTLLELVIVIALAGILLALTVVGVQSARAVAHRTACLSNLRQFGIAIQSYHVTHRVLPAGTSPTGHSTHVTLLPYMDRRALYERFDLSQSQYSNHYLRDLGPAYLRCPASSDEWSQKTNYAANFGTGHASGYDGVFSSVNRSQFFRLDDIRDGASNTVAVSEVTGGEFGTWRRTARRMLWPAEYEAFVRHCLETPFTTYGQHTGDNWIDGSTGKNSYFHVLPPNTRSCSNNGHVRTGVYSAGSEHPGGVHSLYADGRVIFVSEGIEQLTWRALGTRDDHRRLP